MAFHRVARGGKSDKIWRAALLRAVKRRLDGKDRPQELDHIADKVVAEARDGNMVAARELGDRFDGKPAVAIDIGVAVQITAIERRIIDPLPGGQVVEAARIEHEPEEGKNG